jgi:hypothetical protein
MGNIILTLILNFRQLLFANPPSKATPRKWKTVTLQSSTIYNVCPIREGPAGAEGH